MREDLAPSTECLRGGVERDESEQEYALLELLRPDMQAVEFDAQRVFRRDIVDDAALGADGIHFWRNRELGDEREQKHHRDEEMPPGERAGAAGCDSAEDH